VSLRRLGGVARHEWTVACLAAVLVAVAWIWFVPPFALWLLSVGEVSPGFANPRTTILGDAGDPTGQAWLLAWVGHAVLHNPGALWDTNAFFPDQYGLALNDTLLGYAPAGFFGSGPVDAVLRYNIVFVLSFALVMVGGYALVRQLGANRVAGALAGAALAFAPWRYGHEGHLNILSTGGITLALAMLARGHGWSLTRGYRPERTRPGWALAGWLVAAWQISLGFGVGLSFFYVLVAVCLVAGAGWLLTGRPKLSRRLVGFDLGGGLLFAAVCGYMAYGYQQIRAANPAAVRSLDYVAVFSPPPRGLAVAPHSSLPWGTWHEAARTALGEASNEKVLLCGFVLIALALLGMVLSIWTFRQRLLMFIGVVVFVLLSLGTNAPLFRLLYLYLPGFNGSRTPGRLILWPTLLLAVLAAGMVTKLARIVWGATLREHAFFAARFATVPLLTLVLLEGLPNMDHAPVPAEPAAIAAATGPLMVLPSDEGIDLSIALWSTDGFPTMVNGASSLVTPGHQAIRDVMRTFPDQASVDRLRALGIHNVVVLRDRLPGTPYQSVLDVSDNDGALDITRRDIGSDVLFTVD
jgi:hypothetical protein